MEPEGSLPCSQEPSISPYPEPDQCKRTVYLDVTVVTGPNIRLFHTQYDDAMIQLHKELIICTL
jgi:hypothetical protein